MFLRTIRKYDRINFSGKHNKIISHQIQFKNNPVNTFVHENYVTLDSGHIMRRLWDSIQVNLMTGLIEGERGRGRPRTSSIDNILMWSTGCGLTGTELMSTVRRSWERWSTRVGNRRKETTAL